MDYNEKFDEKKLKPGFLGQDYNEYKLAKRPHQLYIDDAFHPVVESIFVHPVLTEHIVEEERKKVIREGKWKRPTEVCDDPKFVDNDFERLDLKKGPLRDCWFVAAVAGVMRFKKLFNFIVPPNQSFQQDYKGLFHFRFWQWGKWVDVLVDDHLLFENEKKEPLFCSNGKEFWAALLEKAYAKLNGCYEMLDGGFSMDAFVDMTGGLSQLIKISRLSDDEARKVFAFAYFGKAVLVCSIILDQNNREKKLKEERHGELLLRIRNPWGDKTEWKEPWSDESTKWDQIDDKTKTEMQFKKAKDGEFWMSWADFRKHFHQLEIGHLTPSGYLPISKLMNTVHLDDDTFLDPWKCKVIDSLWPSTCFKLVFLLVVHKSPNCKKNPIIIDLMQKDTNMRYKRSSAKFDAEHIGFYLSKGHKIGNKCIGGIKKKQRREVNKRYSLGHGSYTLQLNREENKEEYRDSHFWLRIYSKTDVEIKKFYTPTLGIILHSPEIKDILSGIPENLGDEEKSGYPYEAIAGNHRKSSIKDYADYKRIRSSLLDIGISNEEISEEEVEINESDQFASSSTANK